MHEYPTREAFAHTVKVWIEMWLQGQMGDKEFRARLGGIVKAPVRQDLETAEREGWT